MRKIVAFLAVIGMVVFSSCTGPEGPPGLDGQDGFLAEAIEITNVSFTSSNNYSIVKPFKNPIYSSDMVLVYRLSGISASGADIWSLIPENHFFSDGTFNFNYDFEFTSTSVNIFMGGKDLGTVSDQYRLNQVFRIVVIPANLVNNSIDKNNYGAVMNALNINESQIQKVNF